MTIPHRIGQVLAQKGTNYSFRRLERKRRQLMKSGLTSAEAMTVLYDALQVKAQSRATFVATVRRLSYAYRYFIVQPAHHYYTWCEDEVFRQRMKKEERWQQLWWRDVADAKPLRYGEQLIALTNVRPPEGTHYYDYGQVATIGDVEIDWRNGANITVSFAATLRFLRQSGALVRGKAHHLGWLVTKDDAAIIAEVNRYAHRFFRRYATVVHRGRFRFVRYILRHAAAKTFACKYRCSVKEAFRRFPELMRINGEPDT